MLALPIFTASSNYRFAVRNSPVDCCRQKKNPLLRAGSKCWRYLFSRLVATIVLPSATVRWTVAGKKRTHSFRVGYKCWRYLFSRPVTRQLSSAHMSLTSVFGMGTGGPSSQSTPTIYLFLPAHYSTVSTLCQVLFSHLTWVVTRGRVELPFAA